MRNVLHGSDASCRVFRFEVEWTEVNRIIGRPINAVESNPNEALLLNVLPFDIKLDRTVGELNPLHVRKAVALVFT